MTRGVQGDRPLVGREWTLGELAGLPPARRPVALVRWAGLGRDGFGSLQALLDGGVPLPPVYLRPGGKEPLLRAYPGALGYLLWERWGDGDPAWFLEAAERRLWVYELTPAEVRHFVRLLR